MALRRLCSSHRNLHEYTKLLLGCRLHLRYTNDSRGSKLYKNKEAKKLRFFVITRYLDYMKNYETVLEKRFPTVHTVYRTFMDGVKKFYVDTKEFVKIVRIINTPGCGINRLTRREIELYDRMPRDMAKIAPVLIVSTLPLANYVIFPLIYMYPKFVLTPHFWTEQQRVQFRTEILQSRFVHSKRVLCCLSHAGKKLNKGKDESAWNAVMWELEKGEHPTVSSILACKSLFMEKPFHLIYLQRNHVKYLLKMHGLHTGWFRTVRLGDRALILKAMDRAILMEGGIHNLTKDALHNSCYIRGLNPIGMTDEDMVKWLQLWIAISSSVDKDSLSLLLHVPILLAYNQPSNRIIAKK